MSLFRTKQVQQTDFTCVTNTILYEVVKQSQIEWHQLSLLVSNNTYNSLGNYEHNSSFSIKVVSPNVRVVDLVFRASMSFLAKVMVGVSCTICFVIKCLM